MKRVSAWIFAEVYVETIQSVHALITSKAFKSGKKGIILCIAKKNHLAMKDFEKKICNEHIPAFKS